MKVQGIISPDWSVPANVGSLSTTRKGGVSEGPWSSLNPGDNCGDDPGAVRTNRDRLASILPSPPLWLRQVHGIDVTDANEVISSVTQADAVVTSTPGKVLAILHADCLPILFCDENGSRIGATHAGWRGLAGGVIEATIEAMQLAPERLIAWLGPAIGQNAYEVGPEVFESFRERPGSNLIDAFKPAVPGEKQKWHLDMAGAARTILSDLGIDRVFGGDFCTYSDSERFFSYRRDGITGRMASLVWLENTNVGSDMDQSRRS